MGPFLKPFRLVSPYPTGVGLHPPPRQRFSSSCYEHYAVDVMKQKPVFGNESNKFELKIFLESPYFLLEPHSEQKQGSEVRTTTEIIGKGDKRKRTDICVACELDNMFSGFNTARKAAWLKLTQLECYHRRRKIVLVGGAEPPLPSAPKVR